MCLFQREERKLAGISMLRIALQKLTCTCSKKKKDKERNELTCSKLISLTTK
jgi:hypothetical protein